MNQFLEAADIDISVMEKGIELWHVFNQEPAILPDRVAAKRRRLRQTMQSEKRQRFFFSIRQDSPLETVGSARSVRIFHAGPATRDPYGPKYCSDA